MTTLQELKNQQAEIREMAAALQNLLTPEQQAVGTIARVTHTLLCDLCEKVNAHLAAEHRGVFPELLSHGDQSVQNMVWGFINNDKPLREAFQAYQRAWLKDCNFQIDAAFIDKTRQILATLDERLRLEDHQMMPKLEATGLLANA